MSTITIATYDRVKTTTKMNNFYKNISQYITIVRNHILLRYAEYHPVRRSPSLLKMCAALIRLLIYHSIIPSITSK